MIEDNNNNHNNNKNASTGGTPTIVKKIEELNAWQEEQVQVLQERQNEQRRRLQLEQKNMYEMMGFLNDSEERQQPQEKNEDALDEEEDGGKDTKDMQNDELKDSEKTEQKEEHHKGDGQPKQMQEENVTAPVSSRMRLQSKIFEIATVFERLSHEKNESISARPANSTNKPKREFLKRGEGLRQRFNVDPDEFRLDKLPRYKYANAHPHLRSAQSLRSLKLRSKGNRRSSPQQKGSAKTDAECEKDRDSRQKQQAASTELSPLKAQEKRFQRMLITSRNACNSTPDVKNLVKTSPSKKSTNRLVKSSSCNSKPGKKSIAFARTKEMELPKMSWAKVLDSQNIKAQAVHEARRSGGDTAAYSHDDTDNLSIFELLEKRANDGTINLNESCIARFMANNHKNAADQCNSDDEDAIPVQAKLRSVGLKPKISSLSLGASIENVSNYVDAMDHETRSTLSDSHSLRVRFAKVDMRRDEDDNRERENGSEEEDNDEDGDEEDDEDGDDEDDGDEEESENEKADNDSEQAEEYSEGESRNSESQNDNESMCVDADEYSAFRSSSTSYQSIEPNNGLFQQFKEVLFSVLNQRASKAECNIGNDTTATNNANDESTLAVADSITATNTSSTTTTGTVVEKPTPVRAMGQKMSAEEINKLQLVKERNAELEREVAAFKDANTQLTKLKQEFELEKALFAQERQESLDEINDIKVKFEMYMHDERVKFEEDKRKLEMHWRTQRQMQHNKERREIAALREELEKLQHQMRMKEQTHAAAQSRLRLQISKHERDQKHFLDEIEQLKKSNKKLETEMARMEREHNNKLLETINKNIAKLAPKLQPPASQAQSVTVAPTKNSTPPAEPQKQRQSLLPANFKGRKIQNPKQQPCKRKNKKIITCNPPNTPRNNSLSASSEEEGFDDDTDDDHEEDAIVEALLRGDCGSKGKTKGKNELRKTPTMILNVNASHGRTGERTPEKQRNDVKVQEGKMKTQAQSEEKESNGSIHSGSSADFLREIVNPDGSKDIWYSNGNLKKISADRMHIRMLYYNKDIKETDIEKGTVKYYYAASNTWHTTYVDGLEILEFPNGQTEHRHKNGVIEIHFPNNSIKVLNPADEHKEAEWRFEDGTQLVQMRNGDKILTLPNGQKEIHTKLNKRREYPDGTVKILYPDGSQETRYSNGRVRLKDKDGKLLMDSDSAKGNELHY